METYIYPLIETSIFITEVNGKKHKTKYETIITRLATSENDALKKARKSYKILKSPFDTTKRTYKPYNINSLS